MQSRLLEFFALVIFSFTPGVRGQSVQIPEPPVKIEAIKLMPKSHFKAPKLVRLAKPVVVAKPKPKPVYHAPAVATASGCVTGYTVSNYALNQLISHESSGSSCNTNGGGCFGLLQACPGAPLRLACGGNPTCQINWFIANKTGGRSWETIWAFWQRTDCRPYCGHWW